MENCAPYIKYDGTCYNMKQLKMIANIYNYYNEPKIKLYNNKKKLLEYVRSICNDTECLEYIPGEEDKAFKPYSYREDLSTDIINRIMLQQTIGYKNFKFIGVLPSDSYKKRVFDLYKLSDILNSTKEGIIFNIDPHDKRGVHWVALFIDNSAKKLYYFDPLGAPPTSNISKFFKNYKYDIFINNRRYQKGGKDCAIYCIEFILGRLNGRNIRDKVSRDKFLRR